MRKIFLIALFCLLILSGCAKKGGSGNEPLDKAAATTLLSYALNADKRPTAGLSLLLEPSGVR